MSNPLKKTMVFLGLAEEELEEQNAAAPEQRPEKQQRHQPQAAEPAPKPEPVRPVNTQRAAVTPLRRVTPAKAPVQHTMNEILTVHPTEYSDAKSIAENFRDGIPVIINLSRMDDGEAKRLIDFASGLAMGLHGNIERVTGKVFLLTPEHIEIGGSDSHAEEDGSFFVAPSA